MIEEQYHFYMGQAQMISYGAMLGKISKYEEQVQTMGLSKEKRKTIDAYVTEVSERWILYAESLYQAGMQKILDTTESVIRTDKMGKHERNFPICHFYSSLPSMRNMYET